MDSGVDEMVWNLTTTYVMYKFVIHWDAGEGMKASRVVFRHETAKNVGNCKFSKLFELQIRLLFQLSRCSCRGP